MMPTSDSFDFQIAHRITEVDAESWDRLSGGQPFTSHQWYRYGEAVLSDCEPSYLIVRHQGQPVARATFWRTTSEPLPVQSSMLRNMFGPVFRRWPLLMCYSPLASISGLILPESPLLRREAQLAISARAIELLHEQGCSFLVCAYLPKEQFSGWPETLSATVVPGPGTSMELAWTDFEAYLQAGDKKDRQHYKRTMREAEKLGIVVRRHRQVGNVDEALALIRRVERRFGSAENPAARGMLEKLEMVNGTFLEGRIGERLVGCGLVLQDNGAQINATLGLAEDVPYVYFMLIYESLKLAFERQVRLMRMGSGAYEVKQQLGFAPEDNNSLLFAAGNPLIHKTGQWLSKHL